MDVQREQDGSHHDEWQKVVVVMPAYNAEKTIRQTYSDIAHDLVDQIILVDDYSHDNTAAVARSLGIRAIERATYREPLWITHA